MQFLKHSHKNGEFPAYEEADLEVVVLMLMAARSYLALKYMHGDVKTKKLPKRVADTYMRFVRYGLEGVPPPSPPAADCLFLWRGSVAASSEECRVGKACV